MKLTLIFCVFLFAAGSHAVVKNVLDMYPEFKQLQDKVNVNSDKINSNTQKINSNTQKVNSNSLSLKANVYAQVEETGDVYITPSHRIIFHKPIENPKGAYSTATGAFTAPIQGIYLFSVTLCQFKGNVWTYFDIIKDGVRLSTSLVGDQSWSSCNSATAVTYMPVGSQVWVTTGKNIYGKAIHMTVRNTFTATLLQNQ